MTNNPIGMESGDKLIECSGCGVTFLFGGGELRYFERQGLSDPKRCGPCRRARREGRQHVGESISEERTDREVDDSDR